MFYLEKLTLTNFRCYEKYQTQFLKGINIVVGNNAVGKTSLVESIYCLAFTKSFKAGKEEELIHHEKEYAIVKGQFRVDDQKEEVLLSYSNEGKKIKRNHKQYGKASEYIGFFNVVVFCPEDLDIVKGAPAIRRRFLDVNITQMNQKYLNSLILYKKILKQRNELLKKYTNKESDKRLLDVITANLIAEAKIIVAIREEFLRNLTPYIEEKGMAISHHQEKIKTNYHPNVEIENMEDMYIHALSNDLLLKTTTIGPHRDDFSIKINDMNAAIYGSQGQQRTASLSLMLGLAELFQKTTAKIIIILDDVFSELDDSRQNEILRLLDQKNQIFITTTSIQELSEEMIKGSNIINITKDGA